MPKEGKALTQRDESLLAKGSRPKICPDYIPSPILRRTVFGRMYSEIRLDNVGSRPSSLKQGWQEEGEKMGPTSQLAFVAAVPPCTGA